MDGENAKSNGGLLTEETARLRRSYIAESCQLHYTQSPLKIMSSEGAYLIDSMGTKYLDCATRLSNVGHCHPCVVAAGRSMMQTLGAIQDNLQHEQYAKNLLKTLPSNFEVCLFTNSGSEANDLAVQLARSYTRRKSVAIMENSFHGSSEMLTKICPKTFRMLPAGKPSWVTVVPLPDTYRGKHMHDIYAAQKYFEEAKVAIQKGIIEGGELACFLSEPVFMVQGMVIPPPGYIANIYNYIKSLGALVIADEIQLGLGRCGPKFWGFQTQGAVPDIVTVGKAIGNGYPLSVVVTSRKIAEALPNWSKQYQCESVAVAIANSVLKVIEEEQLVQSGLQSMDYLFEKLTQFKDKHYFIGDVRKIGLVVGVDVVWNKESRKPDPTLAEKISYRLKENNVIVANEGFHNNILTFMPPFCITTQDVDMLVVCIGRIFAELQVENSSAILDELYGPQPSTSNISMLSMGMPSSNFVMEEPSSPDGPDDSYDYAYSDDEARKEAEAYADMD
ncbi:5-phosphohydroxy-L-lysine phospho-lyase-like [Neocloeon triangulifer]|uniref:5-phosphohydroxy-L-lysine phospho-lyase-like n=1 Tax=Neocloeon triangulifer TaxID=2078957 RepID=UPI00286F398E|nr:5-phosphohydroxy-L-lysine phospho-lyase-like [Neocloeon triangulifer]